MGKRVVIINGSPHKSGNTSIAIDEVVRELSNLDIETDVIWIGTKPVQGCIACGMCKKTGKCQFKDELYHQIRDSIETCDGLIIASPVYYGGPNGSLCAILDRIFYSSSKLLKYRPAASIVVCRRGGASASFDRLNKYFTINSMPVVSSQYWNSVHGKLPGEAKEDLEGLQTMRTLARNMAWMIHSINNYNKLPLAEENIQTSFVRK